MAAVACNCNRAEQIMNSIISHNMDQIKELCRRYSVKSLYLFGSAATEDQFTNDSDIDFLVALKPEA
jgi:predicted nucleotidyltransferase